MGFLGHTKVVVVRGKGELVAVSIASHGTGMTSLCSFVHVRTYVRAAISQRTRDFFFFFFECSVTATTLGFWVSGDSGPGDH